MSNIKKTASLSDIKPFSAFMIDPMGITVSPDNPRTLQGEFFEKDQASSLENSIQGMTEVQIVHMPDQELQARWMAFEDESPQGLDPVLRDFLKANPRYMGQNSASRLGDEKATIRNWGQLSNLLVQFNRGTATTGLEGHWVAPERLVGIIVGHGPALALLDFAREKGLTVVDKSPYSSSQARRIETDEPGF